MEHPRSSDRSEKAARWAARLSLGELTPARQAELDAWLQADRRHRGALLRAQAALHALEAAAREGVHAQSSYDDTGSR
ncbi:MULTISPECIES: FecR/PupR family sigma factor regulator [unclassified Luteimonas]